MALVGSETDEGARACRCALAVRVNLDLSIDDGEPGVLLDLMLAELLARLQHDQDGTGAVIRMEHDRIARPIRRVELEEVPALHWKGRFPARLHSNARCRLSST